MTAGIRASFWCWWIPVGSTKPLPFSLVSSIADEVGLASPACQPPVTCTAASRTADLLRFEGSGGRMEVPAALTASPAGSGCASRHPSRVLPAPGWITFPPPLRGGDHRMVDQLAAIGWITVTPPLKGSFLFAYSGASAAACPPPAPAPRGQEGVGQCLRSPWRRAGQRQVRHGHPRTCRDIERAPSICCALRPCQQARPFTSWRSRGSSVALPTSTIVARHGQNSGARREDR